VRSLSYLPNLLSSLRISLAPGMLGAAYSNSKAGFVLLMGVALLTDALDGLLARRWNAKSEIGRRLDHWGDALTMTLGALGVYFLWPVRIEAEWQAALLALVGYAVLGIDRLWRRPDLERTPNAWGRISALAVPISLILLIIDWSPWPFRAAATLQALIALKTLMTDNENASAADEELVPVTPIEEEAKAKVVASTGSRPTEH
jgi:phosphatidylglycerophosphate synthase